MWIKMLRLTTTARPGHKLLHSSVLGNIYREINKSCYAGNSSLSFVYGAQIFEGQGHRKQRKIPECSHSPNTSHTVSFHHSCLPVESTVTLLQSAKCVINHAHNRERQLHNCFGGSRLVLGHENYLRGQHVRHKTGKKKRSSEDNESDSDDDDALEEDDFEAPSKFKVIKIHAASTRVDAVVSNSLDVSRNRIEEAFFGPGFLLNGKKMLKKAAKMDEGDYVDMVMEKTEGQLKVKRVKLLKIYAEKTGKDKMILKVRAWKAPFLIVDPDEEFRPS